MIRLLRETGEGEHQRDHAKTMALRVMFFSKQVAEVS